jgi:glycosyltransferase involved in cell wall biosynthesis
MSKNLKLKVLQIIPYTQLYPPKNGGMLRNYFLCNELSKYVQMTLIVLQSKKDFENQKEGYFWNNNIRILAHRRTNAKRSVIKKLKKAFLGRWYQRSFTEPASSLVVDFYPVLKKVLKEEQFDAVIFSHLFSLKLLPIIRQMNPSAFTILDAHNVDHLLFAQENNLRIPAIQRHYQQLLKQESTLYEKVDTFICCSENDKKTLEDINQQKIQGFVVPNGADTYQNEFSEQLTESKRMLFCGSLDYEPNRNGLIWFYDKVWPILIKTEPAFRLTIIGRNASPEDYHQLRNDSTIDFVGEVDDVKKYYYSSFISIVPLHMGSGTRLKILEAMSLGTVVVSTGIGAEGILCNHDEHLCIANTPEDFAHEIITLSMDKQKTARLRKNARLLVDSSYSWKIIGSQLHDFINDHVDRKIRNYEYKKSI